MSSVAQRWLIVGAVLGAVGVILGAYSAHGLDAKLAGLGFEGDALLRRHANFETAVRYQMFHALAIVLVALLLDREPRTAWRLAAWAYLLGTLIFSGLLYVLALAGEDFRWLGRIVPFGGLLLIVGWLAIALGAIGGRCAPSTEGRP